MWAIRFRDAKNASDDVFHAGQNQNGSSETHRDRKATPAWLLFLKINNGYYDYYYYYYKMSHFYF